MQLGNQNFDKAYKAESEQYNDNIFTDLYSNWKDPTDIHWDKEQG